MVMWRLRTEHPQGTGVGRVSAVIMGHIFSPSTNWMLQWPEKNLTAIFTPKTISLTRNKNQLIQPSKPMSSCKLMPCMVGKDIRTKGGVVSKCLSIPRYWKCNLNLDVHLKHIWKIFQFVCSKPFTLPKLLGFKAEDCSLRTKHSPIAHRIFSPVCSFIAAEDPRPS